MWKATFLLAVQLLSIQGIAGGRVFPSNCVAVGLAEHRRSSSVNIAKKHAR
jgi:hypothetical protein